MAPSLVQSASNTGISGTSVTVTLPSPTTQHNCLVVCFGGSDGTANPQISSITLGGSAGNFASANTAYNDADCNAAIWIDRDCVGAQTSVVINFIHNSGGAVAVGAWVMEWSNVLTVSPLDTHPIGVNGSGSSWSSGSTGTLAQATEVAIGCIAVGNISAVINTPSAPWSELGSISASSNFLTMAAGYQVVSSTSALTYNGTTVGTQLFGTAIITLKGTATATTPISQKQQSGRSHYSVALGRSSVSTSKPVPTRQLSPPRGPTRGQFLVSRGTSRGVKGTFTTVPPPVTPSPFHPLGVPVHGPFLIRIRGFSYGSTPTPPKTTLHRPGGIDAIIAALEEVGILWRRL